MADKRTINHTNWNPELKRMETTSLPITIDQARALIAGGAMIVDKARLLELAILVDRHLLPLTSVDGGTTNVGAELKAMTEGK